MFWRVFCGFMLFGLCAGEVYAEDGGCPTPLPYNATCKDGKIYCADAEVSGKNIEGYECINKRWVCTSYVCSWEGTISAPCSPEKFKSVTEKLSEIALSPCGRRSAEEMPRNIPDEPENYDDTKIYDFRCDIRSKCDTMPIPKSARKDYRCVVHKHRVMQCDEPAHGFDVLGLRCTNPKGCPCFDDTCKKGQFCTEGLCKWF